MQPYRTHTARFARGVFYVLLLPILVLTRRDVSFQSFEEAAGGPLQEGDSTSMLQGHVSVQAHPDLRSPLSAASVSKKDVLRPYLIQQFRVRHPSAFVFLGVTCVSVCIALFMCASTQAWPQTKSSQDAGGDLPAPAGVSPEPVRAQIAGLAVRVPPIGDRLPPPPMKSEKPATPLPICPALVMPECEARLLIPKQAIPQSAAGGELVIFGLSGSPLLHAFIREGDDHRILQISMWHDIGTPCASIRLPSLSSFQPWTRCEILGPGNVLYGSLQVRPGGWGVVAQSGVELLVISGDAEDLQLTIKSVTGTSLATAHCGSSARPDHVIIEVGQGNDLVLIVVSAIALLLLSSGSHFPPGTANFQW